MRTIVEENELRLLAEDFAEQVRSQIKTKMVRRRSRKPGVGIFQSPVNASGKLAASVHHEWTDEGIDVLCNDYIDKLIFGQAPGEEVSTLDIEQWLRDKGLDGQFNARTIAMQIQAYGSSIWQEHKGKDSGLLEDVDITKGIESLQLRLTKVYADLVAANIIETFKIAA